MGRMEFFASLKLLSKEGLVCLRKKELLIVFSFSVSYSKVPRAFFDPSRLS